MPIKKVFKPNPDWCYFEKGKWIERGYKTWVDADNTLEERIFNLELHFSELNDLLIECWGNYQPEMSPEMKSLVDKIMLVARDYAMETNRN